MTATMSLPLADANQAYAQARSSAVPGFRPGMNKPQMQKAAQDFEAFFVSQMMQPMFAGIETDEIFGGGQGEEVWKSMMIDEYAKETARKGGLGIADSVMSVMLKAQEQSQTPESTQ